MQNLTSDQLKLKRAGIIGILIAIFIIFFMLIPGLISLYIDWTWFSELGFEEIFTKTLWTKIALGVGAGIITALALILNGMVAKKLAAKTGGESAPGTFSAQIKAVVDKALTPISLVIGLFAGLAFSGMWEPVLKWIYQVPFGENDPVFNRDIAFYVFDLPMITTALSFVFWILGLSIVGAATIYFSQGVFSIVQKYALKMRQESGQVPPKADVKVIKIAKTHLLILVACLFITQAINIYYVKTAGLLFSQTSSFTGANYTDIHATLPLQYVLSFVCLVVAVLLIVNIWQKKTRLMYIGFGLYIISLLALAIYPAIIQHFIVIPNELSKETPYIERNIDATLKAWKLNNVEKRELSGEASLTMQDIADNELTIKNIRLWDRGPLLSTFGQIQEIRTYYDFVSIDDDRYTIDGDYRQVMLSPRELNSDSLPNKSFINERFTFTHGYGLALGPVNQVTDEGLPLLFIKDIPPVSDVSPLEVTRPEIYFGELSNDYIFTKTKAEEFDYPQGENNVFTEYEGTGGVPINSLWEKLLYSVKFGSLKILLSGDIDEDSRILFNRLIWDRDQKVLPYLELDKDPYMVITDDGKLKWIYDTYTISDQYPYSQTVEGMNYMRNSVKIVIDAYDGSMDLYVADPDDPLIKTYQNIFPGAFKSIDEMPEDLRKHVRYPETIFDFQTFLYRTYHMGEPNIFYNKEDQWEIPYEQQGDEYDPMFRHLIMKLPGEESEEFILMLPFTPRQKDNMISWMAARADGDDYGKLVVYQFGKQKLVYGPKQVVNLMNQDAEISQQISLWDQRGSEVIQGNLFVIPIEESLVYVRPIYIKASGGKIPELKRVIVAYENSIAMAETLDAALAEVFGSGADIEENVPTTDAEPTIKSLGELASDAEADYEAALAAQRAGDWEKYGEQLELLKTTLEEMNR